MQTHRTLQLSSESEKVCFTTLRPVGILRLKGLGCDSSQVLQTSLLMSGQAGQVAESYGVQVCLEAVLLAGGPSTVFESPRAIGLIPNTNSSREVGQCLVEQTCLPCV